LIAAYPRQRREESRLMVLHRAEARIECTTFQRIDRYLEAGDLLVVNDTRVFPARLRARRTSGGRVEILLLHPVGRGRPGWNRWKALVRGGKPGWVGSDLRLEDETVIHLEAFSGGGRFTIEVPADPADPYAFAWEKGEIPLPPYILRARGRDRAEGVDVERYQTIYARHPGAVAAPTAGLHFSQELLDLLRNEGVGIATVTLHVGPGTFEPIRSGDLREHAMAPESYEIPAGTIEAIAACRARGRRVVAVGTTVVRTLEGGLSLPLRPETKRGWTDLFIRPPFSFRFVDALVTNFHLPRSTLLCLVSAFAGRDFIRNAYQRAVAEKFHFYSYGDAMLIL
ncbi:MAG: tRNA preQ1(34) S-adenosylmethionine ribosyltransferase-isomerase QueA, partial [Deltaproteobacteria bacterium]